MMVNLNLDSTNSPTIESEPRDELSRREFGDRLRSLTAHLLTFMSFSTSALASDLPELAPTSDMLDLSQASSVLPHLVNEIKSTDQVTIEQVLFSDISVKLPFVFWKTMGSAQLLYSGGDESFLAIEFDPSSEKLVGQTTKMPCKLISQSPNLTLRIGDQKNSFVLDIPWDAELQFIVKPNLLGKKIEEIELQVTYLVGERKKEAYLTIEFQHHKDSPNTMHLTYRDIYRGIVTDTISFPEETVKNKKGAVPIKSPSK